MDQAGKGDVDAWMDDSAREDKQEEEVSNFMMFDISCACLCGLLDDE